MTVRPGLEHNQKWFRNLAMAETLVETLRPLRDGWLATLRERGASELARVRAEREREQAQEREQASVR